jgi:hypothetical protein
MFKDVKLDPVCNISSKFEEDRAKIDKVIKYFMRPLLVVSFPGSVSQARVI